MIFIDRSIPRSVADSLKLVRTDDIAWLEDHFPHNVRDEEWLAVAGSKGWLVITRDKKIRSRPRERALVVQHAVGMFVFAQRKSLSRWEYYKLMGACLDEMERLFATTPAPFMYFIDSGRQFRRKL